MIMKKRLSTNEKVTIIAVIIVVVALLGLFKIDMVIKFNHLYNKAWNLAISGNYSEAKLLFDQIDSHNYTYYYMYKSSDICSKFCEACKYNNNGDYKSAHLALDQSYEEMYGKSILKLNAKQYKYMKNHILEIEENYNGHKKEYVSDNTTKSTKSSEDKKSKKNTTTTKSSKSNKKDDGIKKCAYGGCDNEAWRESAYCAMHKCRQSGCNSRRTEGSGYCYSHSPHFHSDY